MKKYLTLILSVTALSSFSYASEKYQPMSYDNRPLATCSIFKTELVGQNEKATFSECDNDVVYVYSGYGYTYKVIKDDDSK